MTKSPLGAACGSVLIAMAAGFFTPTATHAAAVYTGTFDPEGPQYIWSGTHAFSVDTACLGSDGWKTVNGQTFYDSYANAYTSSCGTVELTGGTLKVKDKLALPNPVEETVNFGLGVPRTAGIWGIFVAGGELKGVDTDLIGSIFFDSDPLDNFEWRLRWESGKAPVDAYAFRSEAFGTYGYNYEQNLLDPVYLSRCTIGIGAGCQPATPDPARVVTFNRVPEPESLALVGMALGAMSMVHRKRRRTAS